MIRSFSAFSIFAVSMIRQSTADHLLGKVMAYTSAITMCVQPVGQMVYLVLIPTGVIVGMIGVCGGIESP